MRFQLDLNTLVEILVKVLLKYYVRELASDLYYFTSIGDDYEMKGTGDSFFLMNFSDLLLGIKVKVISYLKKCY